MLDAAQFRSLIVKPALLELMLYSEDAIELLMFTCANESNGGTYIKQLTGPALGIFQMEPNTYNDIWHNYIVNRHDLLLQLQHQFNINGIPDEHQLIYDLRFATVMARIHYARVKEPIPDMHDLDAIWS